MKAVILAAGQGTRLRPLTDNVPKALVEVRGQVLLERQFRQLKALGVSDVFVVTGYKHAAIDNLAETYDVKTVFNPEFYTTNMVYSLSKLSAFLGTSDEKVLILYGDIAYSTANLNALCEAELTFPMQVLGNKGWLELWSQRLDNPLEDAETFVFDENFCLMEIGAKPISYEQVQAQFMGMLVVSEGYLRAHLEQYIATANTPEKMNLYMTDFIQTSANTRHVGVTLVDGGWVEVDTLEDYQLYSDLGRGDFGVFGEVLA